MWQSSVAYGVGDAVGNNGGDLYNNSWEVCELSTNHAPPSSGLFVYMCVLRSHCLIQSDGTLLMRRVGCRGYGFWTFGV